MNLTTATVIDELIEQYPSTEAVLADHGIELDEEVRELTLAEACEKFDVDFEELSEELEEAFEEVDDKLTL